MATDQIVRACGPVSIGPLTFLVQELPVEGEIGLRAKFRAMARDAWGPGSFYANVMPAAKWAREQGQHQDAAALVSAVAPFIATKAGASEDAAELYRQSPDGVAWELYFRTRQTHPDATQNEFRAVLNEVNALTVHVAILEALAPKVPPGDGTTPSG